MTADADSIGLATVNVVLASYRKEPNNLDTPPKVRGHPPYSINISHLETVRTVIRKANLEGRYISLEDIQNDLKTQSPTESFHISTLSRTLDA